uniref:Reverse transcriptase domain-containing protein n=1 Tax=Tanacetum cinerariifolium TaxID=118510 RepID=A0A699KKD7_TANCI|nr:hypothetical protein [Tanacetum cinerariifolium]
MNQNFYNSNSSSFDQSQPPQSPVIHSPPQETSIETVHDQENEINSVETFLRKFTRISFFEMPKELAEYINTPGWNRPAFYNSDDDDDEDCTIAITSDFLITESLSMGDEHLNTIPKKESDEFIKSCVKTLVSIPNSKGDTLSLERLLHDDPIPLPDSLDFSYVVRVFLPFFTYPVTYAIFLSSGSEDTIFDPGIFNYHFLKPSLSHRSGTFMKFNKSPIEILSSTCSPMDQ